MRDFLAARVQRGVRDAAVMVPAMVNGTKLLPRGLGVALEPPGASLVAPGASPCQGSSCASSACWQRAGAAPGGARGEARLGVKPGQGSGRLSSSGMCTLLVRPRACRDPQEGCAALGEAGRSG